MKRCTKCEIEKPIEEFAKHSPNKYRSNCLACERERQRKYREENREKIRERGKKYCEQNPEKARASRKKYREQNPEKVRAGQKKWRQENPEKIVEQNLRWYKENPEKYKRYYQTNREKILERGKKWRQENPDMCRAYQQKRRARSRNAPGNATTTEIQARFDYHGNRCYYCGCDGKMTIEHRIPLSRGGSNWPSNIVPACSSCNFSKRAKTEKEFLKLLTNDVDNI